MRQTTFRAATISLFVTLTFAAGTALAQSTPAPAQTAPAHAHQQGMDHGGQQMHDQMMKDHQAGAQKQREGDQKTPIGVYHVTANLPRQKLTDFYGSGAFPLNYPNAWDKRMGRNGHGIWLHGVPSDTYSRPPRASDGCIVLSNADLEAVGRTVQIGLTPVIIADEIEWMEPGAFDQERGGLAAAFEAWRADWESRDSAKYLSHYAARFRSEDQDLAAWSAHKRKVNAGKEWIKVPAGTCERLVGGSLTYSDPKFQEGAYDASMITQCVTSSGTAANTRCRLAHSTSTSSSRVVPPTLPTNSKSPVTRIRCVSS